MQILGLTGSVGTGKSTVAGFLKQRGAKIFDADEISHQLLAPGGRCAKRVLKEFGKGILTNGAIDRRKLAAVVFHNAKKLKNLCAIIHPQVTQEIKKHISILKKEETYHVCVIDAPLLMEAGLNRLSDLLIVVKASRENQIKRTMKRMTVQRKEVLARIKAQMPLKDKLNMADIVIDNNGGLKQTQKQVKDIWQKILKISKKKQ